MLAGGLCACIIYGGTDLWAGAAWNVLLTSMLAVFMLLVLVMISRQPRARTDLSFQVPWVPVVPALSVIFNLYLMLELDAHTWIRFSVWMALGEESDFNICEYMPLLKRKKFDHF